MPRRPKLEPLLLAALVACAGCFTDYAPNIGDDTGTSSSSSSSTDPGTTGTSSGETTGTSSGDPIVDTVGDSDSSSSSGSTSSTTIMLPETTTTTPVDPYDQCVAQTMFECGECLCDKCLAEYTACAADRGCVAIETCAVEFGCNGAECLGPCGDVIDMYGGFGGESLELAIDFSNCFNNSCC